MQFGVLGTGVVGETLATALVGLGHQVCMGSRAVGNDRSRSWQAATGDRASAGTFAEAASFGDVVINATSGVHSLAALEAAGVSSLSGKVLVDVANPLDFSAGFPPRLAIAGEDSLGEQIQRAFPKARVVKALNTMTASVMVDPASLAEPTDVLLAGDDAAAKTVVTDVLAELGWSRDRVRDLGGIEAARSTEMYLMLWLSLMRVTGTASFNIRVVSAEAAK